MLWYKNVNVKVRQCMCLVQEFYKGSWELKSIFAMLFFFNGGFCLFVCLIVFEYQLFISVSATFYYIFSHSFTGAFSTESISCRE